MRPLEEKLGMIIGLQKTLPLGKGDHCILSLGIELQYRIDRHQEGREWQSLPAKTLLVLLPIFT